MAEETGTVDARLQPLQEVMELERLPSQILDLPTSPKTRRLSHRSLNLSKSRKFAKGRTGASMVMKNACYLFYLLPKQTDFRGPRQAYLMSCLMAKENGRVVVAEAFRHFQS